MDQAVYDLFEGKPAADVRLAGFGAEAFDRVQALYAGRPPDFPSELSELIAKLGRESIDCFNHARIVVACANPSRYLDKLPEHPDTVDAIALRDVDDPRAVAVLIKLLGADDWLVRYHAVRSLAARPEPEAAEAHRKPGSAEYPRRTSGRDH